MKCKKPEKRHSREEAYRLSMQEEMQKIQSRFQTELKLTKSKEGQNSKNRENRQTDRDVSEHDENSDSSSTTDTQKGRKKNLSKKQRKIKTKVKKDSIDSVYGADRNSRSEASEAESLYHPESRNKEIRLITQMPKVDIFRNQRSQDVWQFFDEYEQYSQQCYPDRKTVWVRELADRLEGEMLMVYKAMVGEAGSNIKYEVLKDRLI